MDMQTAFAALADPAPVAIIARLAKEVRLMPAPLAVNFARRDGLDPSG